MARQANWIVLLGYKLVLTEYGIISTAWFLKKKKKKKKKEKKEKKKKKKNKLDYSRLYEFSLEMEFLFDTSNHTGSSM
jgi:hypothetical protein